MAVISAKYLQYFTSHYMSRMIQDTSQSCLASRRPSGHLLTEYHLLDNILCQNPNHTHSQLHSSATPSRISYQTCVLEWSTARPRAGTVHTSEDASLHLLRYWSCATAGLPGCLNHLVSEIAHWLTQEHPPHRRPCDLGTTSPAAWYNQ